MAPKKNNTLPTVTTLIKWAKQSNFKKIKEYYQTNDINKRISPLGGTFLDILVELGATNIIEYILENFNPNIESRDDYGRTLLANAVLYDKLEIAKILIQKGADLTVRDNNKLTLLLIGVHYASIELFQYLVNEVKLDINESAIGEKYPISRAIEQNKPELVSFLLSKEEIQTNFPTSGDLLFQIALKNKNKRILNLLLNSRQTDVNATDRTGTTPLMAAVELNNIEAIDALIKRGANVNAINNNIPPYTCLIFAVRHNNVEAARMLLEAGADINMSTYHDMPPIMYAESREMIDLLLKYNPNLFLENIDGMNCIEFAITNQDLSDIDVIYIITKSGININTPNSKGRLPIEEAIASREKNFIQALVEVVNADLSLTNSQDETLLMVALREKKREIVYYLLTQKKITDNINAQNDTGQTALIYAIYNEMHDVAKYLTKNCGADIEIVAENGHSPLISSLSIKSPLMINIMPFVSDNAINQYDAYGNTPLYYAVKNGDLAVIKCLIKKGADKNFVSADGQNLLFPAIESNNIEVVKYVLELGIDVNALTTYLATPLLHSICTHKCAYNLEITKLLLATGAKISLQHPNQKTFLQVLVKHSHPVADIDYFIRTLNIDVNEKDDLGATALMDTNSVDIARLLIEKYGANVNITSFRGKITPLVQAISNGNLPLVIYLHKHCQAQLHIALCNDNALSLAIEAQQYTILKYFIENVSEPELSELLTQNSFFSLERAAKQSDNKYLLIASKCLSLQTIEDFCASIANQPGYNHQELIANPNKLYSLSRHFQGSATTRARARAITQLSSNEIGFRQAIEERDELGLKLLLSEGFNIDTPLASGETALVEAVSRGDLDNSRWVVYLVTNGANVNAISKNSGLTVAQTAWQNRLSAEVIYIITQPQYDINQVNANGDSIINFLAKTYPENLGPFIKSPKLDLEVKDQNGWTALMHLIKNYKEEITDQRLNWQNILPLIKLGARLDQTDNNGANLLHHLENHHLITAQCLINTHNLDLENRDSQGKTPFLSAISHNQVRLANYYADIKANINAIDACGDNALLIAIKNEAIYSLKFLIKDLNFDVEAVTNKTTALSKAINTDRWSSDIFEVFNIILTQLTSEKKYLSPIQARFALIKATKLAVHPNPYLDRLKNHIPSYLAKDTYHYLLKKHRLQDPSLLRRTFAYSFPTIDFEAEGTHQELLRDIEENYLDMAQCYPEIFNPSELSTLQDRDGNSIMGVAAIRSNIDLLRYSIFEAGMCPEHVNKSGYTPLMLAAAHSKTEAFEYLYHGANANLDTRSELDGHCTLSLAVENGRFLMFKKILTLSSAQESLLNHRINDGSNLLSLAVKNNHSRLVKYLLENFLETFAHESCCNYLLTALKNKHYPMLTRLLSNDLIFKNQLNGALTSLLEEKSLEDFKLLVTKAYHYDNPQRFLDTIDMRLIANADTEYFLAFISKLAPQHREEFYLKLQHLSNIPAERAELVADPASLLARLTTADTPVETVRTPSPELDLDEEVVEEQRQEVRRFTQKITRKPKRNIAQTTTTNSEYLGSENFVNIPWLNGIVFGVIDRRGAKSEYELFSKTLKEAAIVRTNSKLRWCEQGVYKLRPDRDSRMIGCSRVISVDDLGNELRGSLDQDEIAAVQTKLIKSQIDNVNVIVFDTLAKHSTFDQKSVLARARGAREYNNKSTGHCR